MGDFGGEAAERVDESPWTLRNASVLNPARDFPLSCTLRLNASVND